MSKIFEKILTKKLSLITENASSDIKNIHSGSYDRQAAEDMLYSTIGPLTDNPKWVNSEWDGSGPAPEDYQPGGQAPQWTPEEVIFAFAGNPSKLFRGGSDSPSHGNRGGSPLWRATMQVAKKFRKERDKSFIEDLYQNGMVPLVRMMKPGFDEGRSPFISYVLRTVKGAIENGPGASQEALAATSDDRATKQVGLAAAMKITDPNVIRQAANVVQGKYQQEASYDKAPGNPFGHYSSDFYNVMNNYADALEGGNPERIDDARQSMAQLKSRIDDANESIRGASSGLGQAISNKDRGAVSGDAVHLRTARGMVARLMKGETLEKADLMKVAEAYKTLRNNLTSLSKQDPNGMEYEDKKRLESLKQYNDIMATTVSAIQSKDKSQLQDSYQQLSDAMKEQQASKKFGVASMDAQSGAGGEGGDLKSTLKGSDGGSGAEQEKSMTQETVNYLLDLGINHDLNALLPKDSKYRAIAQQEAKGGEVGGKMTVNEFRYILRSLGESGSEYPGKGVVRKNLTKARDAVGWWQPGEDPELEPLPSGEGTWNSIWVRGGYQSMGPTEISNEITQEVEEFNNLGIKTARQVKTDSKGEKSVASKVAVSNTIRSAKVKMMILAAIHKEEIGMGESVNNKLPKNLFTDKIDREIIVEAAEAIIRRLDRVLMDHAISLIN